MSTRPGLNDQLKQLPDQDAHVLRLKYGKGLTYSEIGRALGLEADQVASSLFSTLKSLDPEAGLVDAKLLGFIHGELPQDELQTLAGRIESDPVLRKEFETWLSLSDDLERLTSLPAAEPVVTNPPALAVETNGSRLKYKMFIGGAAACAAAVALAVTLMRPENSVRVPPPAADHALTVPEPKGPDPMSGVDGAPVARDTASIQKMEVVPSKLKVSDNLSSKKVLLALRQRLDGKPSCIPAGMRLKSIRSIIRVAPSGAVVKVDSEPRNSAFTQCLVRQLEGRPAPFKSSNKRRAEISVALRNAGD